MMGALGVGSFIFIYMWWVLVYIYRRGLAWGLLYLFIHSGSIIFIIYSGSGVASFFLIIYRGPFWRGVLFFRISMEVFATYRPLEPLRKDPSKPTTRAVSPYRVGSVVPCITAYLQFLGKQYSASGQDPLIFFETKDLVSTRNCCVHC
jgi:hypothetical protein